MRLTRFLAVSFAVLVALAPNLSAQDHVTTTPVPNWWYQRHLDLNQRIATADAQLVFLGDSITQGWEESGTAVWQKYYGDRSAVNLGISGDRTQNLLWRIQNGNLEGASPKVAVILIGVNNLGDDSVEDVAAGVGTVLKGVMAKCPGTKVLLLAVLPAGATPGELRSKISALNEKLAPMANGSSVHYLDLASQFLDERGRLSADFMGDYLHPTELGYELWARGMEAKLAELLGDTPRDFPMPAALQQVRDLAIEEIRAFIAEHDLDLSKGTQKTKLPMPPKLTFDPAHRYLWCMNTSVGNLQIELMPDVAPMHVSSTLYLTELGFYDNLNFHRVISGFMAQGGCPLGTGTGGPGYGYDGEFKQGVIHDRRGQLSMANTGRPASDGSQFFLTFVATPHLNGKHTLFGQVVSGMEVLDAMEKLGTQSGTPKEAIQLIQATIKVEPKN